MQQGFGKSLVLTSENKVSIVRVLYIAVDMKSLCGEVVEVPVPVFFKKVAETVIVGDIQLVPVVKTCTFEVLVTYLKAQRTDKMKSRTRNSAGTGDIPCILRYLGFNENNVKIMYFNSYGIKLLLRADNSPVMRIYRIATAKRW